MRALVGVVVEALAPAPTPTSPAWAVWWTQVGRWVRAGLEVGADPDELGATAALATGLARMGARESPEHVELRRLFDAGEVSAEVVEAHALALKGLAGAPPAASADYPAGPDWPSASEIAAELGVTAQKVGRLATRLALRELPHSQTRLSRAQSGKTVTVRVYSPAAVRRIRRALAGGDELGRDGRTLDMFPAATS